MTNLVSRFVKDKSGATAIEYGLIAAGISVAIIAVVQGLGSKLKSTFQAGLRQPEVIQRRLSRCCKGSGGCRRNLGGDHRLGVRHWRQVEDRLPECVGQSEVVQRHLRYCREAPAIAGAFLFSMAQPEIHRCRDLRMY